MAVRDTIYKYASEQSAVSNEISRHWGVVYRAELATVFLVRKFT